MFNLSRRNLSYGTDKLPALSGIASRVVTQFNFEYCAGIWWEDFTRGLLWYVSFPKAPSKYLAPSWSWDSVNGEIYFVKSNLGDIISLPSVVLDSYHLIPATTDPSGQLQIGGYAKLQAPMVALTPLKQVSGTTNNPWFGFEIVELKDDFS